MHCRLLIPGLWFYMIADVLRRWLQSQGIVRPVVYAAIGNVLLNVLLIIGSKIEKCIHVCLGRLQHNIVL